MNKENSSESKHLVIYSADLVKEDKAVIDLRSGIQLIRGDGQSLEILDQESQKTASSLRSQIKDIQKTLKKEQERFIGDDEKRIKAIKAVFKSYLDELDQVDTMIESKEIAFYNKQQEESRKLAEKIAKENEKKIAKGKMPQPLPSMQIQTNVVTEQGSTNFQQAWTYRIIDEKKIPREYCVPHPPLLNQAVRNGIRNIPGVEIFQETRTTRRS